MTLSPDMQDQERLLRERQRNLQALAHPGQDRPRHHNHVLGHDDPRPGLSYGLAQNGPARTPKPREAFRLAADGVVCWELCSLERQAIPAAEPAAQPEPLPSPIGSPDRSE